jgi:hypothetical protein
MQKSKFNQVQVQGRSSEEIKAAENKKREEEKLKKTAIPIKQKKYFDVKLTANVPCLITYRVLADDENAAINQIGKIDPISVKPTISQKRDIKALVYDAGSSLLKLTKIFRV